jgi:hypothetical protein
MRAEMLQSDVGMYLVGLFLRLGVPLGLTLFFAWLLKNIDLQWLEQSNGLSDRDETETPLRSQGCWILNNLANQGPVSSGQGELCWKVRMRLEGNFPDECLDCEHFEKGLLKNAA